MSWDLWRIMTDGVTCVAFFGVLSLGGEKGKRRLKEERWKETGQNSGYYSDEVGVG